MNIIHVPLPLVSLTTTTLQPMAYTRGLNLDKYPQFDLGPCCQHVKESTFQRVLGQDAEPKFQTVCSQSI